MLRLVLFAIMLILAACSTARPTSTPPPGSFDINASVSATKLSVGETLVVTTDSGPAGLTHYSVLVDGVELSRLSYDGSVVYEPGLSAAMYVIEQSSDSHSATWILGATESGDHEILVMVRGEIGLGPGGPWVWSIADALFIVTIR